MGGGRKGEIIKKKYPITITTTTTATISIVSVDNNIINNIIYGSLETPVVRGIPRVQAPGALTYQIDVTLSRRARGLYNRWTVAEQTRLFDFFLSLLFRAERVRRMDDAIFKSGGKRLNKENHQKINFFFYRHVNTCILDRCVVPMPIKYYISISTHSNISL